MTSTPTERPCPDNETSSFIGSSTLLDNISRGNSSIDGNEIPRNHVPAVEIFPISKTYGYSHLGFLYIIVVIGIAGNILLFIMMRQKQLNSLSYAVYLKSLALSDSFVLIAATIRETEKVFSLQGLSLLSIISCKIFFSFRYLVTVLSPWLMVGLTLDRYVCVRFPLTRNLFCTRRKATVVCFSMFVVSGLLILPLVVDANVANGKCVPSEEVQYYFMFLRLVFASTIPCVLILILNILITVQLHRSHIFRNTFTRSRSDSTNQQKDNATRPLVLVSVLAFVTLLPLLITEAVGLSQLIFRAELNVVILTRKTWLILYLVYLVNFGQNFYILMGSSSNYRSIIKQRLACCKIKRNERNSRNQGAWTSISPYVANSGSASLDVPLPSMSSGLEA